MSETQRGESIELWLIDACQQMGVSVDDATDDFFDAGGNSLSLVRLIARTDAQFGEDVLTADELVENSSIQDIASCIRRNHGRADSLNES